jgi:hypothetical protein
MDVSDQQTGEALHWLQKSSTAGHGPSLLMLGELLSRLPYCTGTALQYLRRAAMQGNPHAMQAMAELLEERAHALSKGDPMVMLSRDLPLYELLTNLERLVPPPVAQSERARCG